MIRELVGLQWMIPLAMKEHWLDRPGFSPYESVFYAPFEDLAYQVNLMLAAE